MGVVPSWSRPESTNRTNVLFFSDVGQLRMMTRSVYMHAFIHYYDIEHFGHVTSDGLVFFFHPRKPRLFYCLSVNVTNRVATVRIGFDVQCVNQINCHSPFSPVCVFITLYNIHITNNWNKLAPSV